MNYMIAKKCLEINPLHPIMKTVKQNLTENKELESMKNLLHLLLETSMLSSGFSLNNPKSFSDRMYNMVMLGLGIDLDELYGKPDENSLPATESCGDGSTEICAEPASESCCDNSSCPTESNAESSEVSAESSEAHAESSEAHAESTEAHAESAESNAESNAESTEAHAEEMEQVD